MAKKDDETTPAEQDPIVYRYTGKAQAGESLIGVPLADIRQSTWEQLPKWSQRSVDVSPLYTKVEAK